MDERVKAIFDKIRAGAAVAGEFASRTANSAGKKASEVYNISKLNLKTFDLNTDIEGAYKKLGKLLYASHCNEETNAEEIEACLLEIDEKMAEIEEIRAQIAELSSSVKCPECGKMNNKTCRFCSQCGEKLAE